MILWPTLSTILQPFLIVNLFTTEVSYHVETNPLICSANQWIGFYMIWTSVMKELMQTGSKELHIKKPRERGGSEAALQKLQSNIIGIKLRHKCSPVIRSPMEGCFWWLKKLNWHLAVAVKPWGTLREMCPNTELFLVRIQSEYRKIRSKTLFIKKVSFF